MQDKLILITIILFVLSLISERIANFFKLYLPEDQWFLRLIPPGKFRTKQDDEYEEKCRIRRVFIIALMSGFAVALFLKADIIAIFNAPNDPQDTLGWDRIKFPDGAEGIWKLPTVLSSIFGCLLTGFFLSFGSKFWHDLLDLLLESKNLRRRLSDGSIYQAEKVEEIEAILKTTDSEIAIKILKANEESLYKISGVHAIGIGEHNNQTCIEVYTSSLDQSLVPKKLFYSNLTGRVSTIPVRVITTEQFIAQSTIFPAKEVANEMPIVDSSGIKATGTFGCRVAKEGSNNHLLLTCYHVLRHQSHSWSLFEALGKGEENVVHPVSGKVIGTLVEAVRDHMLDVALVKPNDGVTFSNVIPQIGIPVFSRYLTSSEKNKTKLKMEGRSSGLREGVFAGFMPSAEITYGINDKWKLFDLLIIRPIGNKPFSLPGDSGALVVDELGYAVGMIVAGNSQRSLAIQFNTIREKLKINLA
jgi:hypothetical protein